MGSGRIDITEEGAQSLEELAGQAELNINAIVNDTDRFTAKVNALEGLGTIREQILLETSKIKKNIEDSEYAVAEIKKKIRETANAIRKYLQSKNAN